jgi:leucyl aminopeptidase
LRGTCAKVNRLIIKNEDVTIASLTKILAMPLLLSMAISIPTIALAQEVLGSGIAPSTAENSAERNVRFSDQIADGASLVVVMDGKEIDDGLPLDDRARANIRAAIQSGNFDGKSGQMLEVYGVSGRPLVLLTGAAGVQSDLGWRNIGGEVSQKLSDHAGAIAIVGLPNVQAMANIAFGATLGQYRFDRYKSDRKAKPSGNITIVGSGSRQARIEWQRRLAPLAEGVRFARDLVNEPANVIYPASFVARTRAAFEGVENVTIEVLDQADMRSLGMGAIAGVGQGSPRGARLMLVTYRGANTAPMVLAGKGITFDTGGISIKSNTGMWEMKGDMSGAAATTGALLSLAKSKAPVHVVAVAALAENMPGANAQRPGDVVRTLSGKTIEIRSTDAEGRLVLADGIEYAVREKQPFALVDIATLTGSAGRALGPEYAALFAREDAHADAGLSASEKTGEALWRLPLHPAYAKAIKSNIADIKNSNTSPAPGASAGAHFIGYFVPEDLPWMHIDMAAVDRTDSSRPLIPAGARGFGVMLLDELARNWRPE